MSAGVIVSLEALRSNAFDVGHSGGLEASVGRAIGASRGDGVARSVIVSFLYRRSFAGICAGQHVFVVKITAKTPARPELAMQEAHEPKFRKCTHTHTHRAKTSSLTGQKRAF